MATLTEDCRADTTLYIQMQQSCPPPKLTKEIHSVSSLFVDTISNIAAEIPARAALLLPPLLTEPTSISQPSAVTSRGSSMTCLQHSKPRNRDLGLGCFWKYGLLYLCLCGRCRLILLAYYLALNASPTEWWKSQSPGINMLSELWDNHVSDPALFWIRNRLQYLILY